jgi:hypothetical protein
MSINLVNLNKKDTIKNYSSNDQDLNPNWVTGFVDGEGAFMLNVSKCLRTKLGYNFRGIFQITVHKDDKFILESIKKFFKNVGHIRETGPYFVYKVESFNELTKVIIPHFEIYPLLSLNKSKSYFLLKKCIELITNNKRRITIEVFRQILELKICFKLGSKAKVFNEYTDVLPFNVNDIPMPVYDNIDPDWISGFVAADGTFGVYERKSISGFRYSFRISQDKVDKKLMLNIHKYFGTGSISETKRGMINYSINSLLDINNIVIPFFKIYKLRTSKEIDFYYFVKIFDIINEKGYGKKWTSEDHEKIIFYSSKMNNARRNTIQVK